MKYVSNITNAIDDMKFVRFIRKDNGLIFTVEDTESDYKREFQAIDFLEYCRLNKVYGYALRSTSEYEIRVYKPEYFILDEYILAREDYYINIHERDFFEIDAVYCPDDKKWFCPVSDALGAGSEYMPHCLAEYILNYPDLSCFDKDMNYVYVWLLHSGLYRYALKSGFSIILAKLRLVL